MYCGAVRRGSLESLTTLWGGAISLSKSKCRVSKCGRVAGDPKRVQPAGSAMEEDRLDSSPSSDDSSTFDHDDGWVAMFVADKDKEMRGGGPACSACSG